MTDKPQEWVYESLKETSNRLKEQTKFLPTWMKSQIFKKHSAQSEYYAALLCVWYGASEEDYLAMTFEERLTYIHLFGS